MTIDLRSTLERLYALIPQGKRLGLERMQAACARFGNPERSFTAVHVAGTNGKGTVCAFVSSMARSAGLRVGTYTSPHLHRFAERIAIDGAPIEDDVLVSVLNRVMDAAPDLTFFEVATLGAFLAFKETLNNVAKHSKASEARVTIEFVSRGCKLVVADNGCGFDPACNPMRPTNGRTISGYGIAGIRTRLEQIGGRVTITSQPGEGTRVELFVPLPDIIAVPSHN